MNLRGSTDKYCTADAFVLKYIDLAEQAWRRGGGAEYILVLGDLRLAVRPAGNEMEELVLPVLRHAIDASPQTGIPDAVVYALSAHDTGFAEPPPRWPFRDGDGDARTRTHWKPATGPVLSSDESRGIWHLHDMTRQTGLYWIRSLAELPQWEFGSPLRHHIHWASMAVGQGMLHSATIFNGAAGAMLAGPGGSGKSTLTAAALNAGWSSSGDDFILVSGGAPRRSHRLYDVMKLTGMAEELFPGYARHEPEAGRADDEKVLIPISEHHDRHFVDSLSISAIFATSLSGAETSIIQPASHFETIKSLAPSTSVILRTGLKEVFAFASDLVRSVPCYEFRVGRDPFEGLNVLDGFLKEIAQ